MSFLSTLGISGSGMTAQRLRLDVVAENIANVETTRTENGGAYRRKLVVLQEKETFQTTLDKAMQSYRGGGVEVVEILEDASEYKVIYNPEHPDANEMGYVSMPNVDVVQETTDAMAATHAYQANITAFNATKQMAQKAMEIGK
jgi:flagellar basal-body rod protein FlgC